jgi:hypothetical protein
LFSKEFRNLFRQDPADKFDPVSELRANRLKPAPIRAVTSDRKPHIRVIEHGHDLRKPKNPLGLILKSSEKDHP